MGLEHARTAQKHHAVELRMNMEEDAHCKHLHSLALPASSVKSSKKSLKNHQNSMLELGGCVVKVDYMEKHYCLFRNTIQQQNISKNNTVCSKHDTAAKLYGKVIPVRPTVEIRYMNDVHDTVGIRSRTQNIQNPIYAASAVYLLSLGQKVAQMASTRECRAQDLGGAGSNPGSCKKFFLFLV